MTRRVRVHRVRRRSSRAQSLVEFAFVMPVLVVLVIGGIAANTFITARSQLSQAVDRAALIAARDPYDVCEPGDEAGQTAIQAGWAPGGYNDVLYAFKNALTSNVFPASMEAGSGAVDPGAPLLTITCTSQSSPVATSTNQLSVNTWFAVNDPADAGACTNPPPSPQPYDRGCFNIWRGGVITITSTVTVRLPYVPILNTVTLSDSAAEQIEPFRTHVCGPLVPTAAC